MEKKAGLILGGILLFSLVLVGVVFADTSQVTIATVTVNTFLSVTIADDPVAFTNMNPGQTLLSATVGNGFPLTATIGAESNVNPDVGTSANAPNFVDDTKNFLVSNMKWSDTSAGTYTGYTISDATVCSGVNPGSACTIYHKLTIPNEQAAGTYSVGITISAT